MKIYNSQRPKSARKNGKKAVHLGFVDVLIELNEPVANFKIIFRIKFLIIKFNFTCCYYCSYWRPSC
jgi:hypothetical protein